MNASVVSRGPIRWLALVVVLTGAACSDPVAFDEGEIRVFANEGSFTVVNRSDLLPLAVVMVDARDEPLILLAPCEAWPDRIPPGGERRIPFHEVFALHAEPGPALVHWCFLDDGSVVTSGRFEVDPG